jgi:hypothetical protein
MATTETPTEFKPLPTTREERGRQIAQRGGIRQLGGRYVVPAQSANSNVPTYLVDVVEQTCTCPDFETRRQRCKHQEAVLFWLAWEGTVNVETGEITLPKKKQQSKQNWPAYNRAQTTERRRVPQFLHSLCLGVPDQERAVGMPGRKPMPDREAVFGLVMKVYSGCSGRRAESDIAACVERGYLSRAWDANTLFRAMESPAMTPILTWMIEEAAGPLAQVENAAGQFAVDATGFKTSVRRVRDEKEVVVERWYDQAHKGEERRPRRFIHDWVKLHAMTGTLTNVVTATRVTAGTGTGAGDSPHFIPLLHTTNQRFTVKEVSGDKGYLDKDNLTAVAAVGALPFVPFKSNSCEMDHPNEHWRRMWAYFDLKKEEFLRHYHRRSNVESTFGAIKAKFGGSVRSKLFAAQVNEVLAKVLLWNLSCIVHAIEEFGVEAEFSRLVMP